MAINVPTYRVTHIAYLDVIVTAWPEDNYGYPTPDAVKLYREELNESFTPGGANYHPEGVIPHISKVFVIRQSDNKVVAESHSPLFEVH
jgi:hypothetical protein